jgi:predicted transcriptional regulator
MKMEIKRRPKRNTTIRLEDEIKERLQAIAHNQFRTMSDIIRTVLMEYIVKEESKND